MIPKKAVYREGEVVITFPYSPAMVDAVKKLSGRRWHTEDKTWTAPALVETIKSLKDWGFELDANLEALIRPQSNVEQNEPLVVPGLKNSLYPFQEAGVRFIDRRNGLALIADSMGLGKTIQALAWLQLHKDTALPAVVLCPASLKLNWEREVKTWTDLRPYIWHGRNGAVSSDTADVHIINYDILAEVEEDENGEKTVKLRDDISKLYACTIVLDEAHALKNRKAQRTKAAMKLCRRTKNVIALTGTPIVNRPAEMYNAISVISPSLFPSFWQFAQRYCGARSTRFGWDFNGSSNAKELHGILTETIMLRRLKEDVLPDLPKKRRIIVPMDINNRAEYELAERDLIKWMKSVGKETTKTVEQLAKFESLKQIAARGKLAYAVEWIKDFLDSGEKLVVFATHHAIIDSLMDTFKKVAVKLDGRDGIEDRQKAVDAFQRDPNVTLFVGNLKAAGMGITLTAASNTAFVELGWTSGDHDQAEDRVHRIGQEAESVSAYYLVAANTIEEDIATLLDAKRRVVDAVLDGKDTDENSLLTELLKKWKEG